MTPPNSNSSDMTTTSASGTRSLLEKSVATNTPLVTLFTMPKPFGKDTDLIQQNAIQSWARLAPAVDVLMIGDEPGIAEMAAKLGVKHAGGVEYNQHGTPLVSSAFKIAHARTESPFLAYCNSDVILLKDFARVVEMLSQLEKFEQFVAFGRRTDLRVERQIDFDQLMQIENLMTDCQRRGVVSSQVCKEYFIFNRSMYQDIPRFAIGRGNWDNWMIHNAKQNDVPVINVSDLLTVIHQAHDYRHTKAGRMKCYVSGEEAKQNEKLAGGRHWLSGSTGTWRLTQEGIRRERPLLLNPAFWADVPRFIRLTCSLLLGR